MRSQMEASAVCHSIFSGDKRSNSPTPPKHQGWDRTMKYHSDKAYEDQNQYKRPNTAWGQMTNTIANSVRSSVPQGPLFQSPDVEKPLFQDASKKQPYAKPPGFSFFKLYTSKNYESKSHQPLQFGVSKNYSHSSNRYLSNIGRPTSGSPTYMSTYVSSSYITNSQQPQQNAKKTSADTVSLNDHVLKLSYKIMQAGSVKNQPIAFYNPLQESQVKEVVRPTWHNHQPTATNMMIQNAKPVQTNQMYRIQPGVQPPVHQPQNTYQMTSFLNNQVVSNSMNQQVNQSNLTQQSQSLLFSNVLPQQNNQNQQINQNQYNSQLQQPQIQPPQQQFIQNQFVAPTINFSMPLQHTQQYAQHAQHAQQYIPPEYMTPSFPYPFNQPYRPPEPYWQQLYYQALNFNEQLILYAHKKLQEISYQYYKPVMPSPPVRELSPFRLDPIKKYPKRRELLIIYSDEPSPPPVYKYLPFLPAFIERQAYIVHECLFKTRILNEDGELFEYFLEQYQSTDEIEDLRKIFRKRFKSIYGDDYSIHYGEVQDGQVIVMPVAAFKKIKNCSYECVYSARKGNIIRDLQLSNEYGTVMWNGNIDIGGVEFLNYPKIVQNQAHFWYVQPFHTDCFVTLKLHLSSLKFYTDDGEINKPKLERVLKRQCYKQRCTFRTVNYDKMEWAFYVSH